MKRRLKLLGRADNCQDTANKMDLILNLTSDIKNVVTNNSHHRVIKSEDIAIHVAYGAVALISVLGNGITIAVIQRNPTLHTLYNFLLLNLAAADFITGFVTLLGLAILVFHNQTDVYCKIFSGVIYCNIFVSINTLTAIAFERYYGIVKPIVHRNRSSKRFKFIIPSLWLSSAVAAAVAAIEGVRMDRETKLYCFLKDDERYWPTWKLAFLGIGLVAFFIGPLITITFLYSKIVMHFKTTNQAQASAVSGNTNSAEIARKRAAKTVRMLILVTALFAVALLPEIVYIFLILYDRKYIEAPLFFKIGFPTLASIAVNPFVYTLSNPTFRQEAKRLFSCVRRGNSAGMMTTSNRAVDANRNSTCRGNNATPQSVTQSTSTRL